MLKGLSRGLSRLNPFRRRTLEDHPHAPKIVKGFRATVQRLFKRAGFPALALGMLLSPQIMKGTSPEKIVEFLENHRFENILDIRENFQSGVNGSEFYVVESGDTYYEIAASQSLNGNGDAISVERFSAVAERMLAQNGLEEPYTIHPGDTLKFKEKETGFGSEIRPRYIENPKSAQADTVFQPNIPETQLPKSVEIQAHSLQFSDGRYSLFLEGAFDPVAVNFDSITHDERGVFLFGYGEYDLKYVDGQLQFQGPQSSFAAVLTSQFDGTVAVSIGDIIDEAAVLAEQAQHCLYFRDGWSDDMPALEVETYVRIHETMTYLIDRMTGESPVERMRTLTAISRILTKLPDGLVEESLRQALFDERVRAVKEISETPLPKNVDGPFDIDYAGNSVTLSNEKYYADVSLPAGIELRRYTSRRHNFDDEDNYILIVPTGEKRGFLLDVYFIPGKTSIINSEGQRSMIPMVNNGGSPMFLQEYLKKFARRMHVPEVYM